MSITIEQRAVAMAAHPAGGSAGGRLRRALTTGIAAVTASALAIIVVIAAVLAALSLRGDIYAVATDSMAPAAARGDIVLVQPLQRIALGEVVTFRKFGSVVTHRLVGLGRADGTYETRGDANPGNDPWTVTRSDIIGRVDTIVPKLGWLLLGANRAGALPAFVALLLTLVGVLRWSWRRATG